MILVTGSAGFIGSNLCHHLCDHNEVLGIDKLGCESNRNWTRDLEEGSNRMIFQQVDLINSDDVNQLFKNYPIKKIVHLAAESHVDRSIDDPSGFWRSNVIGTNNLFAAALEHGVDLIINQITDEAYGEKPEGEAFEGDKFNPTSPYPCSKVAQYWVGRSYHTTYGLPVVSTFPVNCYGPRQYLEKLIPRFIYNLTHNRTVPLMTSTHFERDWLPVDDMCFAHEILLARGVPGEDYNVGADNHRSNKQLTEELLEKCGRTWWEAVKIVPDRSAHDCRYAVNCNKLKALGWGTGNSFDTYLDYTVKWYKENWGK